MTSEDMKRLLKELEKKAEQALERGDSKLMEQLSKTIRVHARDVDKYLDQAERDCESIENATLAERSRMCEETSDLWYRLERNGEEKKALKREKRIERQKNDEEMRKAARLPLKRTELNAALENYKDKRNRAKWIMPAAARSIIDRVGSSRFKKGWRYTAVCVGIAVNEFRRQHHLFYCSDLGLLRCQRKYRTKIGHRYNFHPRFTSFEVRLRKQQKKESRNKNGANVQSDVKPVRDRNKGKRSMYNKIACSSVYEHPMEHGTRLNNPEEAKWVIEFDDVPIIHKSHHCGAFFVEEMFNKIQVSQVWLQKIEKYLAEPVNRRHSKVIITVVVKKTYLSDFIADRNKPIFELVSVAYK